MRADLNPDVLMLARLGVVFFSVVRGPERRQGRFPTFHPRRLRPMECRHQVTILRFDRRGTLLLWPVEGEGRR